MSLGARHDDLIDSLTHGHRELLHLLDLAAGAGPGPTRSDLLLAAADALRRHVTAEERYLHPQLRLLLDDGERRVDADVEEHEQLERLLLELEATDPDSPGTQALLRGLACAARRHIEGVERSRLPALRHHLTMTELTRLARLTRNALHDEPVAATG